MKKERIQGIYELGDVGSIERLSKLIGRIIGCGWETRLVNCKFEVVQSVLKEGRKTSLKRRNIRNWIHPMTLASSCS